MPRINKSTGTRKNPTPGIWRVVIPHQYERGGTTYEGVQTVDPDSGLELRTRNGDEMWRIRMEVIDEHPKAPKGQIIFDQLVWSEKGQARGQTLLDILGVYDDLADGEEIHPSHLFDRPFAVRTKVNAKGWLETNGYSCFYEPDVAPVPEKMKVEVPKPKATADAGINQEELPF